MVTYPTREGACLILGPPIQVALEGLRGPEYTIEAQCSVDGVDITDEGVIREVPADGWVIDDCSDPDSGKVYGITDSGKLQDSGGADYAR